MKNIWLNHEQLEYVSNITLEYVNLHRNAESIYEDKFLSFLHNKTSMYEKDLKNFKVELKKTYQLKNDCEMKKNVSLKVKAYLIQISTFYQCMTHKYQDKVLSFHGYQSLMNSYSIYKQILEQLDSETIINESIFYYLELSYHYLIHAFYQEFWISPPDGELDYQRNYVSKFLNYCEILDYSVMGCSTYTDYLSLCQNFRAMEMECIKVSNYEKEEFDSSVFDVAMHHPEFLSYYDEETLKSLKDYIYLKMNEVNNEEKDSLIELVYKINRNYLKLSKK